MTRLKAAEERRNIRNLRPSKPVPFKPRWLKRLTDKDMTDSIYSDGAYVPRGSGGAA
jgi:hypothetical protein